MVRDHLLRRYKLCLTKMQPIFLYRPATAIPLNSSGEFSREIAAYQKTVRKFLHQFKVETWIKFNVHLFKHLIKQRWILLMKILGFDQFVSDVVSSEIIEKINRVSPDSTRDMKPRSLVKNPVSIRLGSM